MLNSQRPAKDEYHQFYKRYIDLVKGNHILSELEVLLEKTTQFLTKIPVDKWQFRYAPGKWSLMESWMHLVDSERIFAYRALRIGRGDTTPLEGFDQDVYVPAYRAESRTPSEMVEEYRSVRLATISLFRQFSDYDLQQQGNASNAVVTVRALGYMIAGHELHHVLLTKERYL